VFCEALDHPRARAYDPRNKIESAGQLPARLSGPVSKLTDFENGLGRWAFRVLMDDSLEMILALLRQLEATVLGLKQLRGYIGQGVGQQMVEELIEEGENKLTELKRKLIQ
jgi:hypothetical protein